MLTKGGLFATLMVFLGLSISACSGVDDPPESSFCDYVECPDNSYCDEAAKACLCKGGRTMVDGRCISTQQVPCKDVAPANAASIEEEVVITYTDAEGWTEPEACKWECDYGYEEVDGECLAVCEDECIEGGTRCDGTVVQACIKDAEIGCLTWEDEVDCGDLVPPESCEIIDGEAVCLSDPCVHECDVPGETTCDQMGLVILTCVHDENAACRVWEETRDCDVEGGTCEMDADDEGAEAFCEFRSDFDLILEAIGNGQVFGAGVFSANADIVIEAVADTGYRFDGWSGDIDLITNFNESEGGAQELQMPSTNVTLNAHFVVDRTPLVTVSAGGSNLGWFHVEPSGCLDNDPASRFAYDIISTFHLDQPAVLGGWSGVPRQATIGILQAMYDNGQRSIRLPVYHRHCGKLPYGTVEDDYGASCENRLDGSASASDAGRLPEQVMDNIADILVEAKSIGFERVIVGFFPIGSFNSPIDWITYNTDGEIENRSVIEHLVEHINTDERPLPEIIWDLGNEFIPVFNPSSPRTEYLANVWEWWKTAYPLLNTLGFSVISTSNWHVENRFPSIPLVFGEVEPDFIAVSLYSQCQQGEDSNSEDCDDEAAMLLLIDQTLNNMPGYESTPLIIAETWFNDATAATSIAEVAPLLSRDIEFVLQWPRERASIGISNCFVSSVAPYIFADYGL